MLVCEGGHMTRSVSFSHVCRSCGRKVKEMVCNIDQRHDTSVTVVFVLLVSWWLSLWSIQILQHVVQRLMPNRFD